VVAAGAVPVFAEVDDTLGLDPDDVAAKVTSRTAAIVAVHLENTPCDMERLGKVAEQHAIPILEDVAQSMGVGFRGTPLGSLGAMGAFSLQLEKNVTAGEGGLITTKDETLYIRAARFQDQGGQFVTSHGGERGAELAEPFCGENLRMTEIAGAIALEQLRKLPALLDAMATNNRRVREGISGIDGLQLRRSPDPSSEGLSSISWFLADGGLARRFLKAMRAEGMPCAQMYNGQPVYATPSILERRTATNKGGPWHCAEHPTTVTYEMGMCPVTEDLVGRSGIIGIGAGWTASDCDDVVAAFRKVTAHLL
jgi:8-amino-3,8-dideoxy-alpha-D-manno-octulosonate transaminase